MFFSILYGRGILEDHFKPVINKGLLGKSPLKMWPMSSGDWADRDYYLNHILEKPESERLASCLTAEQGKKAIVCVSCIPEMPGHMPVLLHRCGQDRKHLAMSCAERNSDCTYHLLDDVIPIDILCWRWMPQFRSEGRLFTANWRRQQPF